jgi:hypothetical protein
VIGPAGVEHPERIADAAGKDPVDLGRQDPLGRRLAVQDLVPMLKLREDWHAQQGGKPSLRAFHDALLSHGSAPFWALRRLMLDGNTDAILE